MRRLFLIALGVGSPVLSQELLWQAGTVANYYNLWAPGSFLGDYDQDGADDLLAAYRAGGGLVSFRILSGTTGAVVSERFLTQPTAYGLVVGMNGVGDFDLDGYPDYFMVFDDQGFNNLNHVQVWSPHRSQQLFHVSGPRPITFGGLVCGRVELDGDGLPDLVIASTRVIGPDVRAYSHTGALLWTVSFGPLARLPLSLASLPDLDNDGCNEILVGGTDGSLSFTRGYLAVMSGRTGAFLRTTYDRVPGDVIGFPTAVAGDVDRDGVADYCTGNYWGGSSGRTLITIYSGATGAILRDLAVPTGSGTLAASLIGGRDVDQDGVPDVIAGTSSWLPVPGRSGRVQAFSSRDLQLLGFTAPPVNITTPSYAADLVDLGVQPGSPYPVYALTYRPSVPPFVPYMLEVWRMSPPRERHLGVGCASAGPAPTISVRRVETAQGDQCRLVLGSAPPGAMAFCVAAGSTELTFAGGPLPYSFDGLGFPGCSLLVPPTLTDTRVVGTAGMDRGYAAIDVPLRLSTAGFGAAAQWLVFDFATGAHATTPRCEVWLQ